MKIQIKLDYNDKVYLSNIQECTDKEVKQIKDLIKKTVEGEANYLSFESGFEEYFFPKSILEMSIITVIVT